MQDSLAERFHQFAGREVPLKPEGTDFGDGFYKEEIHALQPDDQDRTLADMRDLAFKHNMNLRVKFPGGRTSTYIRQSHGSDGFVVDKSLSNINGYGSVNVEIKQAADGKFRVSPKVSIR